jgi:hypothetical protein
MRALRQNNFELRGQFAGFIRNAAGKRRMLLRIGGADVELKLPAELREAIQKRLSVGLDITVAGSEESSSPRSKRVVSQVAFESPGVENSAALPPACVRCPIQVCTKKNCWRGGGKELWRALEHELQAAGLADAIALQPVDCLDNCKRGPNITCNGELLERCTAREAHDLVQQLAATAPAAPAHFS